MSESSTTSAALPRMFRAGGESGDRLDLLVHALAQLPDQVQVAISCPESEAARLRTLARAYAIEDRLFIEPDSSVPEGGRIVTARPGSDNGLELDWTVTRGDGGTDAVTSMAELIAAMSEPGDPPASCRTADDVFESQRIAVVTNQPSHYRVPLLNGVADRIQRAGGEVRVLFTQPNPQGVRPWLRHAPIEFDHLSLTPLGSWAGGKAPIDLVAELRRFRPTIVVSGGFSPLVTGRAIGYGRREGIPTGIWSGDTHRQATKRGRARGWNRKRIAKRADFAISYGWLSAEYLRSLAPELPVAIARNTAPFHAEPDREAPNGSRVRLLCVSRAIQGKGLDVLADAFVEAVDGRASLTVIGSGPELDALVAQARDHENVTFVGAVDSDQILDAYAHADAFLFPSQIDVFGLVLVEAMGSGLAAITTPAPGAVGDLCLDGQNSIVLAGNDKRLWVEAIRDLIEDDDRLKALGARARNTVLARWTMDHSVDAWLAGVRLGLLQAEAGGA